MPKRAASSSGPSGSSVAAKRARMKQTSTSSPQHGSKNYMRYGTSLYGRFLKQTSTGKMASKKTFHLRYKERNGPPAEATAEVQDRVDLTVKQIKSIVPKAKGSKKKDVQRSAMEVATYAQVKKLHKRLGFRDNANTQAVRSNIAHLWFAAQ